LSEDYVLLNFYLETKVSKRSGLPKIWLKINVPGENEIVTTFEYTRAWGVTFVQRIYPDTCTWISLLIHACHINFLDANFRRLLFVYAGKDFIAERLLIYLD